MTKETKHASVFGEAVQSTLEAMFGFACEAGGAAWSERGVLSDKGLLLSVVFNALRDDELHAGEYLIGIDERLGAQVLGIATPASSDAEIRTHRSTVRSALAEALNTAVGTSIVDLYDESWFTTFGAPRIQGEDRAYPRFEAWRTPLTSAAGAIDCCFYRHIAHLPPRDGAP